jgi:ABC-type transporter Mla subunit MlaD
MRMRRPGRRPAATNGQSSGPAPLRILAVVATLALLGSGTALALGAGDDEGGDGYLVRAVFDNASFVISGEDVKIAGVKVGSIDELDLQDDNKAAVVLRIEDKAFQPFRADARCRIVLQSLIGEQYVECAPTQKRAGRAALPPPLKRIERGKGKGQYLLGVQNTNSPVGVDLINNIMRLPYRERFRLIINELGAGLAGNGTALRAAIRRASPALQQADRVVAILARQNRLLGNLIDASDEVLGPWAQRRKAFGEFINQSGATAAATAERGADLERDFRRFPGFLRELIPAMQRFEGLADQMGPALQALDAQAPAINATTERFGPFAAKSQDALVSLGDVADQGRKTFPAIRPAVDDLATFGRDLRPLASGLGALFSSFDDQGGVEDFMRFIYFYTGATNGEDAVGHFLRSSFAASNCSTRVGDGDISSGCSAFYIPDEESETGRRSITPEPLTTTPPPDPEPETTTPTETGEQPTPGTDRAAQDAVGETTADTPRDAELLDYLLGQEGGQ